MADFAYCTIPYTHLNSDNAHYMIAVTGHQYFDDDTELFLREHFKQVFTIFQRRYNSNIVVLSGLAAGADTLFAEIAILYRIQLIAGLAAEGIVQNFTPGPARERFLSLCAQSHAIHQLDYPAPSEQAYMALGKWLVDSADLLVAAWNGQPAVGLGGTGDVVAYALQQQKPVIHMHTQTHRLHLLTR